MKLFKRIAVALALGSALTIGSTQAQDIKIAYNADMSGTAVAELGVAARWGFEAAIEDINKKGGLLGRKVVAVIRDDLGTPPKSIQNMTELIDNEKVVGVVGIAQHRPVSENLRQTRPVRTHDRHTRRARFQGRKPESLVQAGECEDRGRSEQRAEVLVGHVADLMDRRSHG